MTDYESPPLKIVGTMKCGPVVPNDATPPVPPPGQQGASEAIYGASRASLPERPAMWRWLRNEGWPINCSWIDESEDGATGDFGELWERITNEIRQASKVVLYAEAHDFPLKGAILEAGIALGMGKPVVVCLPGVTLEGRSTRPIGSWIAHPLVTRIDDIKEALAWKPTASPPAAAPAAKTVTPPTETVGGQPCLEKCSDAARDESTATHSGESLTTPRTALKSSNADTSNGCGPITSGQRTPSDAVAGSAGKPSERRVDAATAASEGELTPDQQHAKHYRRIDEQRDKVTHLLLVNQDLEKKLAASESARLSAERRANKRLCASCLEHHPIDVMCPPHEVRTTGQQWFRERIAGAESRLLDAEKSAAAMRERIAEVIADIDSHYSEVELATGETLIGSWREKLAAIGEPTP